MLLSLHFSATATSAVEQSVEAHLLPLDSADLQAFSERAAAWTEAHRRYREEARTRALSLAAQARAANDVSAPTASAANTDSAANTAGEAATAKVPNSASTTPPTITPGPDSAATATVSPATAAHDATAPPTLAPPTPAPPATAPPDAAAQNVPEPKITAGAVTTSSGTAVAGDDETASDGAGNETAGAVAPTTTLGATVPTEEQWEALRQCESSGNYRAISLRPAGLYRGAYQFYRPTWDWVAPKIGADHLVGVDPAEASPADQDRMAKALWNINGWAPWPACSRMLGYL